MMSNSEEPQGTAAKPEGDAASATSTPQPPRARLTRLKINRFRNVKPGTELRFDDGINVLLGRNGTGKTTLLELVCAVVRGDLRAYEQESFDLEFDILLARMTFAIHARNTVSEGNAPYFPATVEPAWEHKISLSDAGRLIGETEANRRGAWIKDVAAGGSTLQLEEVSLFRRPFYLTQWLKIKRPNKRLTEGIASVHIAYMLDGLMSCLRMDEGLDVFRCMTEGKPLPGLGQQLTICPDSGLNEDGSLRSGAAHLLYLAKTVYTPHSVFLRLSRHGQSIHERMEVGFRADELLFMSRAANAMNVGNMQLTTRLLRREKANEGTSALSTFGHPSFWITTHRGTTFTHDKLSYGEKRLLAFLYHAAANPQILVADELVNGLHHGWIQTCLAAIQGQAFLTSQNPLLLDHLPFASAEEVQRRFILCDRDEHGDWIWRNMDEDAASAFYRAYKVGIQHVSEILETKGLW
jgi:ABC-type branched-subunit amino acid transport system ATPase component